MWVIDCFHAKNLALDRRRFVLVAELAALINLNGNALLRCLVLSEAYSCESTLSKHSNDLVLGQFCLRDALIFISLTGNVTVLT